MRKSQLSPRTRGSFYAVIFALLATGAAYFWSRSGHEEIPVTMGAENKADVHGASAPVNTLSTETTNAAAPAPKSVPIAEPVSVAPEDLEEKRTADGSRVYKNEKGDIVTVTSSGEVLLLPKEL